MTITMLLILHLLVAIGAYVQATTGFAFGLIVMAGIGSLGIMPLEDGAIIVMLLSLINATLALKGQYITKRQFKTMPFSGC